MTPKKPIATALDFARGVRRFIFTSAALVFIFCLVIWIHPAASAQTVGKAGSTLDQAYSDLQIGKADEALQVLMEQLKSSPGNAQANNLMCRVDYMLDNFDRAAEYCQKAVTAEPSNASYHHWLGRATGERASRASFLSAYPLAKKTRDEFETAAKLDPKDSKALADLGEFYVEAPGVIGGGLDKAESVAQQLDVVDSTRAHLLRAQIAAKQKDYGTAERELKAATNGPHPALAWMELAGFYRRQQRWAEMTAAIRSGESAASKDSHSAEALLEGASVLIKANREPNLALALLSKYIDSPDKTEEGPAFVALNQRAALREHSGDAAGAASDRAQARQLAHEYKSPQESKPQESRH